ncbi:MAG: DUF7563 family protein [Halobacteriota archaeon]
MEKIQAGASNDASNAYRCRNCGRHVTATFARVFGDNQNLVHGCLHCTTQRERKNAEHISPEQRTVSSVPNSE